MSENPLTIHTHTYRLNVHKHNRVSTALCWRLTLPHIIYCRHELGKLTEMRGDDSWQDIWQNMTYTQYKNLYKILLKKS